MKKSFQFLMLFVSLIFMGCSHNLRITNADDYFASPAAPPKEALKLGVMSSNAADPQSSRYVNSIIDALQRTGGFERVIYPYNQALHKDQVNVVADITVIPHYSGEGLNFLVNWPGFLIFAPAIWGYGYNAEIETKVNVTRLIDGNSQQITVPTKYRFRQAEIDRTWTEIGWLEVGVIPLIGGIVFTQYDTDVTDEFITKVSPNYGSYVAKRILEAL
ncbi:MAG: hypothetical protein HY891_07945 [Deltaproteobacteria bacterium]|nr:hypothetical protein [Deltaproteobacteria bacterium]